MTSVQQASSRICSLEELSQRVHSRRTSGERIVLVNGAFDLFHVGHLRYLEAAGQYGEFLVAAINSDSSVRAGKGPGRPRVPEMERAEIVAGLRCVDAVVLFDADTVEPVIKAIRPDAHAKGTDYTVDSVPERTLVVVSWRSRRDMRRS